jgi:predicted RNase H-like HicB family nuclease
MKLANYAELNYSIRILNNGDRTFSVEVPKLPGCFSTGRNKNECIRNIAGGL